jgi:sulfite reductase alpha subunit-like flavoprotein
MLVLYGSETGNALDVAELLVRRGSTHALDACALPMDQVPVEELAREKLVVFVCSTTGAALASLSAVQRDLPWVSPAAGLQCILTHTPHGCH